MSSSGRAYTSAWEGRATRRVAPTVGRQDWHNLRQTGEQGRRQRTSWKRGLTTAMLDYLAREKHDILAHCTLCGKCVEVCPMPQYDSTIAETDAVQVVNRSD